MVCISKFNFDFCLEYIVNKQNRTNIYHVKRMYIQYLLKFIKNTHVARRRSILAYSDSMCDRIICSKVTLVLRYKCNKGLGIYFDETCLYSRWKSHTSYSRIAPLFRMFCNSKLWPLNYPLTSSLVYSYSFMELKH